MRVYGFASVITVHESEPTIFRLQHPNLHCVGHPAPILAIAMLPQPAICIEVVRWTVMNKKTHGTDSQKAPNYSWALRSLPLLKLRPLGNRVSFAKQRTLGVRNIRLVLSCREVVGV